MEVDDEGVLAKIFVGAESGTTKVSKLIIKLCSYCFSFILKTIFHQKGKSGGNALAHKQAQLIPCTGISMTKAVLFNGLVVYDVSAYHLPY